jgi:AcrR family transcriptional regulator
MPTTVSDWAADNRKGDSTNTRKQILDCAEGRFRTFGYGNTTMAEIAGDADMSAANLYRYVDKKQELGVSCAKRCIEDLIQALRSTIRRPEASASEMPMAFAAEIVRLTHEITAEQPRVNELVEMVTRERHEVVRWRDSRICGLIARATHCLHLTAAKGMLAILRT